MSKQKIIAKCIMMTVVMMAELEEFYDYSSRYLIQLLDDPPLHHIYMEQNILVCMASVTNLDSENTTFRNPPSQLLDVPKCTGNCLKQITNDQVMLMGSNFATQVV